MWTRIFHEPILVFVGFVVAVVGSWVCAKGLGAFGFMDIPSGRRKHPNPTPRTAGVALAVTLALGELAGILKFDLSVFEWVSLVLMVLLGIVDDLAELRARHKALGGLIIAILCAVPAATKLTWAPGQYSLLGFGIDKCFPVLFFLLVLMLWAIPQAFNLIDGANGVAIGSGLIVLLGLGIAYHFYAYAAGAVLGVLLLNWPKAKHFLGDTGSLSLGLLLAILAVHQETYRASSQIIWLFAYPTMDVLMVVTIRLINHQHPGVGDRNHLHYQWGDRILENHPLAVAPVLWLNSAACVSGIFVNGYWRIIPWVGLCFLIGQCVLFATWSTREGAVMAPKSVRMGTQPRGTRAGSAAFTREFHEDLGRADI